jgi:hypothetical protein
MGRTIAGRSGSGTIGGTIGVRPRLYALKVESLGLTPMPPEKETGRLLSKSGHVQKLIDRRSQLMDMLSDQTLNATDRAIVKKLLIDIQDALSK